VARPWGRDTDPAKVQNQMNRMTIACVFGALLIAGPVLAQTPPPAGQTAPPAGQTQKPAIPATPPAAAAPAPVLPFPADAKIGFVQMQMIVDQSRLGKAGTDKMQKLQAQKNNELAALNKQIATLANELETQKAVLSATVQQAKASELDKLQRQAQFQQQESQAAVQALQTDLFTDFTDKVLPIIDTIRKERGLWAVYALGDGSGVAAVDPALDLSAEIIKRLDATIK
jgi:outer membrane protein